jgi:acetate kinase
VIIFRKKTGVLSEEKKYSKIHLMRIFTINAGSTSLKFSLFESSLGQEKSLISGNLSDIGCDSSLKVSGKIQKKIAVSCQNHRQAYQIIQKLLDEHRLGDFDAVAHRVVHGGDRYIKPTLVTIEVLKDLKETAKLAPLHLGPELSIIEDLIGHEQVDQIACFDTAFHHTIPYETRVFPLPHSWEKWGVKRYGFHGLSCEYVMSQIDEKAFPKVIIAHLGGGCSLTAVKEGKSIYNSMGLTPLGGVIMGSRPGDIDPGIMLHLLREKKVSLDKMEKILNHQSGLLGISGITDSIKDLEASSKKRASYAIDLFVRSISREIASLFIELGGADLCVFCGGIGENSPSIRQKIVSLCQPLKMALDPDKNAKNSDEISSGQSAVKIKVIATDENKVMARDAFSILK